MNIKNILSHAHGISEKELYEAYKIFFGTLVSESRLKIINILRKGRKNVSEIVASLKVDQTAVSHDLTRMKKCGFVTANRDGKYIYYELNRKTILPLMSLIDKHMAAYCVHILRDTK